MTIAASIEIKLRKSPRLLISASVRIQRYRGVFISRVLASRTAKHNSWSGSFPRGDVETAGDWNIANSFQIWEESGRNNIVIIVDSELKFQTANDPCGDQSTTSHGPDGRNILVPVSRIDIGLPI